MLRRSSLTFLLCLVALASVLINYTDARPSDLDDPLDPLNASFANGDSGDVSPGDEVIREDRAAGRSRNTGRIRNNGGGRRVVSQTQSHSPVRTVKHEEPRPKPFQNTREHLKSAGQSLNILPEVSDSVKPQLTEMVSTNVVGQIAQATGMQPPYNMGYGNYGGEYSSSYGGGYGGGNGGGYGGGNRGGNGGGYEAQDSYSDSSSSGSGLDFSSSGTGYDDYSSKHTEDESYEPTSASVGLEGTVTDTDFDSLMKSDEEPSVEEESSTA